MKRSIICLCALVIFVVSVSAVEIAFSNMLSEKLDGAADLCEMSDAFDKAKICKGLENEISGFEIGCELFLPRDFAEKLNGTVRRLIIYAESGEEAEFGAALSELRLCSSRLHNAGIS